MARLIHSNKQTNKFIYATKELNRRSYCIISGTQGRKSQDQSKKENEELKQTDLGKTLFICIASRQGSTSESCCQAQGAHGYGTVAAVSRGHAFPEMVTVQGLLERPSLTIARYHQLILGYQTVVLNKCIILTMMLIIMSILIIRWKMRHLRHAFKM